MNTQNTTEKARSLLAELAKEIDALAAPSDKNPWTLTDHMLRFFPTWDEATMPPHRQDFTEDMLPDGWRPRIKGEKLSDEIDCKHDSTSSYWGRWQTPGNFIDESEFFFRTRRPLPSVAKPILTPEKWAAEKAAFARGEKIQVKNGDQWIDFVPRDKNDPPPWTGDYLFRVKPILTPEQIAAGWIEWHGGECPVWGGSRPTVLIRSGETMPKDIVAEYYRWDWWKNDGDIIAYLPDRYESLKKAHSEGRVIQCFDTGAWHDDKNPNWFYSPERYRVKPEPVLVALGPDDVTPGSEFLAPDKKRRAYAIICEWGVEFKDIKRTFKDLLENGWKINRNDGLGFVLCSKPADAKEGK